MNNNTIRGSYRKKPVMHLFRSTNDNSRAMTLKRLKKENYEHITLPSVYYTISPPYGLIGMPPF